MAKAAPPLSQLIKNSAHYTAESTAWEFDALERKPIADYLTPFITSITEPFVVSVDASYGGGKSYFLQNWKRDLDASGYLTVFFNAWETDFSNDPLLAFMTSINEQLSEKTATTTKKVPKKTLTKLTKFAPRFAAKGGALAFKALARRYLGDDGLEEFKDVLDDDTEDDAIKEIAKAMEDLLSRQAEEEAALEGFRTSLEATIAEITEDLDPEKQKLIVFVDELDRCRPSYAVEVLERIKHFFSVRGMVFILGVDERQIANAMSAVYGQKLDTDGYLRRFIDWRFRLPKPRDADYSKFLAQQFGLDKLRNVWGGGTSYHYSMEGLLTSLGVVSEALSLSLRQQEQNFTEINLLLRTLDKRESPLAYTMGILVPLRTAKLEKYERAFAPIEPGPIELAEVRELFSFLREHLEQIGGLKRLGAWSKWEQFEGTFIGWFIDKSILGNVNGKISEHNDVLNSEESRRADYKIRQMHEYERGVWSACFSEANDIHTKYFPRLGTSVADIVRQRLENAGRYLLVDGG